MMKMTIDGVTATATEKEVLTAGRVGLRCAFEFAGGDWGGLFKTAVFQGIETVDVALTDNECVVPWEAMAVEGVQLKVGVYGANGNGDIVIPTVWANFGKIQPSAVPSGVDPQTPSQNANAYAVETAEQALAVAQSVETRANNGEFDGAPGADGATIWLSSAAPEETITPTKYIFLLSGLSGGSGSAKSGDLIFYGSDYYLVDSISGHSPFQTAKCSSKVSVKGDTGAAPTDQQVQDAVDEYLDEHPVDEQVQDAVDEYLGNHPTVTGTFTNAAKRALIALLEKVAFKITDGREYLDALENELSVPVVTSISAAFTQGSAVIYDTDSLDTLKQYLVVTATYFDSTTEVLADSVYTLSGNLEAGESTITVSYGGKTDTFDVVVSIGLDSIAYASLTYRDIFITNNLWFLSDFEGEINLTSSYTRYDGDANKTYKINAGSPSISQEAYNSASHSLKCFGSGSAQIVVSRAGVNMSAGQYLTCAAVNCLRYSAGKLGIQWGAPITGTVDRLTVSKESTTNGFEAVAGIMTLTGNRTDFFSYVGSMSSANLDGYVDDVIITPLPSGMTLEQGLALYENYLAIRRNA